MKSQRENASLSKKCGAVFLTLLFFPANVLLAGGPLLIGGPKFGIAGQPFVWDNSAPIAYRVDTGPLAQQPNGGLVTVNNAAGVSRVNAMFANWSAVPTANLAFTNTGPILAVGAFAGGDVKTLQDFLAVAGDMTGRTTPDPQSCAGGGQNPIIFDADGTIFAALGLPPEVIGFEFPCTQNPTTGKITSAGAILNGEFQDGINNGSSNLELTQAEFDQAFTHEFGHFLGLDHSQINVDVLLNAINTGTLNCTTDDNAGMPLMFPALGLCPARTTAGLPILSMDDAAWVSRLYPVPPSPSPGKTSFSSAYGILSGTVFFSDGTTPAQGVNIIARSINLPRRNAVSVVSGFLFTGNPGQTVTCVDPANPTPQTCSNLGDSFGSRDPKLIGHFEIPLPPGTYTLSVESVFSGFSGSSGVGPLSPPIPAPGTFPSAPSVSITAGATTTFNITLLGTLPRFDAFESAFLWAPNLQAIWLRREQMLMERQTT